MWPNTTTAVRSKGCERDRTNSPGLFLHWRPAAADVPPLRVGRLLTFLVDLRSAPATKQPQDTGRGA